MWKTPVSVLCGCLAALPLIGCAADVAIPAQATAVTPTAIGKPSPNYAPAPRVYAVGPAAPAAVLVLWPGEDTLARDSALWTAQGFDVVMPRPADIYRLVADQQAALARLLASAHALADAPVWVMGPAPVIDAALAGPQLERGEVSGVVITTVASGTGSCSESFFYSDPGTGAPPKVEVNRSGDCGTGRPAITGRQTVGASGAPNAPAKPAAPHRGIDGREEFAVGRKGATPRRADQINASWLKETGPALAASAGPGFAPNASMRGKEVVQRVGSRSRPEQARSDSHSRRERAAADSRNPDHKHPEVVAEAVS